MKIILDGILEGMKTRQDGSVSLSFGTQELDSSKAGELFQLRGKYCKVLFSDTNISKLEEELVDQTQVTDGGKKRKSQSSRLRAVLHVWFQQQGTGGDFDEFYKNEMEKIIQHYKGKLE